MIEEVDSDEEEDQGKTNCCGRRKKGKKNSNEHKIGQVQNKFAMSGVSLGHSFAATQNERHIDSRPSIDKSATNYFKLDTNSLEQSDKETHLRQVKSANDV